MKSLVKRWACNFTMSSHGFSLFRAFNENSIDEWLIKCSEKWLVILNTNPRHQPRCLVLYLENILYTMYCGIEIVVLINGLFFKVLVLKCHK